MPAIGKSLHAAFMGYVMDMSMDGSPIIDRTPIDGLYLNCGWCYGALGNASFVLFCPSARHW